ncbi:MAG: MbtH family NRPS accessory protein [Gammaproteobacteria bacterium]
MSIDPVEQDAIFKVLVNCEEHYSLWPADLPVPCGWTDTGHHGPKCECDKFVRTAH